MTELNYLDVIYTISKVPYVFKSFNCLSQRHLKKIILNFDKIGRPRL